MLYILYVENNFDISFFPKPTERLALIRQQRAEAAKKRDEEKAGNLSLYYLCS